MAKKTIWDVAIEINGKSSGASKAIMDVQKQMKNLQEANKKLSKNFGDFAKNAGKLALGVAGGVTAIGAATLKLAGDFATAGDQAAKTADSLGMGIEGYQKLRYAMGTAGVQAEEFDGAIQKMSNTIKMGASGNDAAAKQLAEIGLSAKKLAGMKPEQAFARISDYMQALPNDADRTRVAIQLFGKTAGPKMMNAMKMGSAGLKAMGDEAQTLGVIITEEQARASENYGDALSRMQNAFGGLKNKFIGSAIGPITQAFDRLKDAMVEQGPNIQELGNKFGNFLAEAVQKLPEIITKIKEFGTWVKDSVTKVANFVGGFENLAKIIAVLAIAPTFISGIKVVISLFSVLKAVVSLSSAVMGLFGTSAGAAGAAAAAGGAAGATGFGAMAAAVWAATWPVLAVIAAIAAVIAVTVLLVKHWDKVKEAAGKAWEGIKSGANKAWEGIKTGAKKSGEFLKNNWKTIAIGIVNPWAGGLKALYDHNEKFRNFVDGTWSKIKDITGKVWDAMPDGVKNVFTKISDTIKGVIDGIKGFFSGLWDAIKQGPSATLEYLKNAFFSLFENIKQKIETFVNFFKEKMEAVKNFFGGIGDKVGGFVGGAVDKFKSILPGHAEGGIFTTRHIAEIAEKGAEAVVPLNKSPQGFDIWKQAGEIGGYANKMSQQTATSSTNGGTPPVMKAAAQRISGGDNIINVNFSQNNTFNGTPDKEMVNQISVAGEKAADDFEYRVKQVIENLARKQRRVSFA